MTITPPYPPNSEIVGIALLRTFAGVTAGQVAANLPKDVATWVDEGFVTLNAYRTGSANVDIPQTDGIVEVHVYAAAGATKGALAPWAKAWRLAGLISAALEPQTFHHGAPVTLPTDYAGARVLSAYKVTEPERVRNDPSAYAHLTFDLAIHWAAVQ